MATMTTNTVRAFNFGAAVRNTFASIADARARRAKYVECVTELNSMTDRELADIGIARSMITAVAREASLQA
ncbi:hypothetical protein BVC71_05975 [Marivivens niveibacter]|uniref:YjiS-like domain-containing protein n=1 Tax=Marivivens niveibacter TaxID=1930667 RepID=A0A251WYM0_9RHOB|nr:DUF1127 domain-containing protein [Marivivens niveibacter]OUD09401.1 hypothetical protein BVC71_05975 [Marivivens niveibacter]